MIAKEYINADIPFLRLSDNLEYGLNIMEDYKLNNLPVIDSEGDIVGVLDENLILDHTQFETTLDKISLKANHSFVEPNQHIFEVLRYAVEYDTNVIPISFQDRKYLGSVSLLDILTVMADINSVRNKGAVLILDIRKVDYSLSELSRIAEDSKTQILSSGISTNSNEPTRIFVTLKFEQEIINTVIESYQRYDYGIFAVFQAQYSGDDKDRLNHLFKYLDL